MKHLTLTFLLLAGLVVFGNEKINYILNSKVNYSTRLEPDKNTLLLRTKFASSQFISPNDLDKIKDLVITKIELVYSRYKLEPSFAQRALNTQRLESLKNLNPELLNNNLIEWQLVEQTYGSTTKEAKELFHGFRITYRPKATAESIEEEIKYIDDALEGKLKPTISEEVDTVAVDMIFEEIVEDEVFHIVEEMPEYVGGQIEMFNYLSKHINYPKEAMDKGIHGKVIVKFMVESDGSLTDVYVHSGIGYGCDKEALKVVKSMPKWNPGKQRGTPVRVAYVLPIQFKFEGATGAPATPTTYASTGAGTSTPIRFQPWTPDSTVLKVFDRKKDWKNMLVVCDFTGSMSPYTAQLLVWHKLNLKQKQYKVKQFTFFNDGDRKADYRKQIGKTGGIYHSTSTKFEGVKALAAQTMRGGYGGDCPENNVEATLKGLDKCPDCESVIMIADNFATPRDLSLYKEVNKPIKIIVCGANAGINVNYLNLALATGGSIHTMEDDIDMLASFNEGKKITIGNSVYKIKDGKFVFVKWV